MEKFEIIKFLFKSKVNKIIEIENNIFFIGFKLYLSSNKPKKK